MTFLSIFCATISAKRVIEQMANLEETAADPTSFEYLIKIDEGDEDLVAELDAFRSKTRVSFKYLVSPKLEGYYSLHQGYDALFSLMSPGSYFCWLLSDEIRVETKGWDAILKKYIGTFDDDVFRVKLSVNKMRSYYDFRETIPCPDNYAVTTRKWLEITGGWGGFWGPDSWHQAIDYYLGLCENKHEWLGDFPGLYRSFPSLEIKICNEETAVGIRGDALRYRAKKINKAFEQMQTIRAQENFLRLAQKLNIHIWVQYEKKKGNLFLQSDSGRIVDNVRTKRLELYGQTGEKLEEFLYDPQELALRRRRYGTQPPFDIKRYYVPALFRLAWLRTFFAVQYYTIRALVRMKPIAFFLLGKEGADRLRRKARAALGLPPPQDL